MQKVIDPTKMPYEETSLYAYLGGYPVVPAMLILCRYVPPVHQNLPPLREIVEQYEWIRPLPPTPTLPTSLAPPHQQQPAIPGPPAAMHPKPGLSGRGSGSAPESQPP